MIIKNCPHCGGEGFLTQDYNSRLCSYFIYVKCNICGAQGKVVYDRTSAANKDWNTTSCDRALAAWNMRTNEPNQEQAVQTN